MFSVSSCYKKGIFWCFKQIGWQLGEEDYYIVYRPIVVYCDEKGNALEELLVSDKYGTHVINPEVPQYSSTNMVTISIINVNGRDMVISFLIIIIPEGVSR